MREPENSSYGKRLLEKKNQDSGSMAVHTFTWLAPTGCVSRKPSELTQQPLAAKSTNPSELAWIIICFGEGIHPHRDTKILDRGAGRLGWSWKDPVCLY